MTTASQASTCNVPTPGQSIAQLVDETEFATAEGFGSPSMLREGTPEIIGCETISLRADEPFQHELGVLHLKWNGSHRACHSRIWTLPLGSTIDGPAPDCFGIRILRIAGDQYSLHLIWNRTGFAWSDLTRDEIGRTSLRDILDSLGTDLNSLLDQPVLEPLSNGACKHFRE